MPLLLTLVATAVRAEPDARMATRAQIDGACDRASAFAESKPDAGIAFWDVTAGLIPPQGQGLWWRIDDVNRWAVVDPLGTHGPNVQMTVWKTPGQVLLVSAFLSSDSGDWAYFITYCYRPEGTLARTVSTFNSFVAANPPDGIRRERVRYFDSKGNSKVGRSEVFNLRSEERLGIPVPGNDEPLYLSVETLPFRPLLRVLPAP